MLWCVLLFGIVPLVGCLGEPGSVLLEKEQNIKVVGRLLGPQGDPLGEAQVFLETRNQPIARTDGAGDFSFQMDAEQIISLKQSLPTQRGGLRLYYEKSQQNASRLVGISSPISLFQTGDINLGTSILSEGDTVRGRIWLLPRNQDLTPAEDATVTIGRWQAFTNGEGEFQIDNVAKGRLPIQVLAAGYGPHRSSLTVDPALNGDELAPVVLFPEFGVNGALFAMDSQGVSEQIEASLRPYRKGYRVRGSPDATWIRLDHRPERLESAQTTGEEEGVSARWIELKDIVYYDFPGDGAYNLYYQFANEDQSETSDVFQLPVLVDRFGGSEGLVIAGGQETVNTSRVTVAIDVPNTAVSMRLAESEDVLTTRNWQPTQTEMEYNFLPNPNLETSVRGLFLQFQDNFGNVSQIYQSTVRLQLFPTTDEFIALGPCASCADPNSVTLTIDLPVSAFEMRIFENIAGGGTGEQQEPGVWIQAQPQFDYTLENAGSQNIFVQFRDENGNRSLVFQKSVSG